MWLEEFGYDRGCDNGRLQEKSLLGKRKGPQELQAD